MIHIMVLYDDGHTYEIQHPLNLNYSNGKAENPTTNSLYNLLKDKTRRITWE